MSQSELVLAFFLQLGIIIAACRIVGWLVRRFFGQPQVVGEMIAGVILGPSLFGLIAPELQKAVFPQESRTFLYIGAQLGVGLYMFIVGLGFKADEFRANIGSAGVVSFAGIAVPFLVAVGVAPWLVDLGGLFTPQVGTGEAILFLGACIAITAFPMLARIIHERGLSGSPLGTLSLSAGAIDDAAAWCVLAIVLASLGEGPGVAVKAIGGAAAFAVFMLVLGPRLLAPLGCMAEKEGITETVLAIALIAFLACAFAMELAGIHAVFGGFLLGVMMPRGALAAGLKKKLEPFTVIALLPMFFTFSGLNTQLSVVNDLQLLEVTLVILVGSIAAKFVACWAAARLTGQDNDTALGIGALMNARGLMELIIINIGLQRGIITIELFSIMVVMAIVTTLMATPLFELVYGRKARARGELGRLAPTSDSAGEAPPATGDKPPS
jgi:Kef-type K+ transport system membrane component KefB